MGGVVDSVVGAVADPVNDFVGTVEKVVTDPTSLTLADAGRIAFPVAGSVAIDQINNPDHAVVAAVAGAGAAAGLVATGATPFAVTPAAGTAAGFAAPLAPAAEILATPVGASLVPAVAPVAASAGGGGLLSTLGTASLLSTLTSAGQKAQGVIAAIPGASSFFPGLLGLSGAAGGDGAGVGGSVSGDAFLGLGGVNDAPLPKSGGQSAVQLVLGAAVLGIPGGLILYYGWKWLKGRS